MKFNLLDKLIMLSKYALKGVLLQCLMLSVIWAADLNAQEVKSVTDVSFNIKVNDVSLFELFQVIEKNTGFYFSFSSDDISDEFSYTKNKKNISVRDVLLDVSEKADLKFKQVNRNIIVLKNEKSHAMPKVEVVIQGITITGKVLSGEDDSGLPGANVIVKGTSTGTVTDIEGNYSLEVPDENSIIVFSSVGYVQEEIVVGTQTVIDVTMALDITSLEEIVVVGYGEQKKATVTGAVASVDGEIVREFPTNNLSGSLVGQIPGLMVVNRSGEPGADDSDIRIRGINTLNDATALIVIDGIANRDGGLARLNPEDIESITVLKDASAAIYGAQAANGVILVTTKRGKAGPPELSFSLNAGANQATRLPEVLNARDYAQALNEIDLYHYKLPEGRYSEEDLRKFADGSDPWRYPNTDWYGETIKPWSPQGNANISLSGGNADGVTYFVSAGTTWEDGYFKNSAVGYNQHNFRSNIDAKLRKNITLRFDVSGRQEIRKYTQTRGGSTFRFLYGMKPTEPAFWPKRSTDEERLPGPDFEGGQNPAVTSTDVTGYNNSDNYVFQSNVGLDINDLFTVRGLSFVANVAIDRSFEEHKNWRTPWMLYQWDRVTMNENGEPDLQGSLKGGTAPELTEQRWRRNGFTGNMRFNYTRNIENHGFGIMAGVERQTTEDYYVTAFRNEYVTDQLPYLDFGGDNLNKTNTGGYNEDLARLNYFGRANYAFKDRYLVEFVFRYDGSQIFDPDYRWGFFPGFSAGWVMTEENFMSNVSWVSRLKLRGSYGTLGNDKIDPYQYLTLFEFGGNYIFNETVDTKSVRPKSVANEGVSWEVAKNSNIGIEGSLFEGKFTFEFDVFKNVRTDILFPANASIPLTAGFEPPDENIGEVENKGFDFSFAFNDNINDHTSWRIGFNGGYAKNKILFWDEPPGRLPWQVSTGKPLGLDARNPGLDLYYNAIGVFKDQAAVDAYPSWPGAEPGDVIFEDVNGDGEITVDDRVRSDKNNFPRFVGGITLGFTWKNLDLSILMQGAAGAEQYVKLSSGEFGNYLQDFFDGRWTAENPSSTKPRVYNRDDQYWAAQRNTHFLRSTDYIRAKNVRLSYTFNPELLSKASIKYCQVFISAMNLFTWDKFKVFDPENSSNDLAAYPQRRLFNLGLNLTF
ncbi:MAG: TonB-dependent receptor [Cytophagales bacterium]|nr:TonB-dependent receptor [Cytophagales bacterium]